jgi:exoribonuclease-2
MLNALAVFKNKPAVVLEKTDDKIVIALSDGSHIKVREKDIEIIHPGPVKNLSMLSEDDGAPCNAAQNGILHETWELLLADCTAAGSSISLKDLAELVYGEYSPAAAWLAFCLLHDGLYFTGTADAIRPRLRDLVEADEKKREEKQRANNERKSFLDRLRARRPILLPENSDDSPDDRRFIQDIEALACGKTNKSRTMRDLGLGETPEGAHTLLLECGFWTEQKNPYPDRFGISLLQVKHIPDSPPPENRRDLTHLVAFAIDSPWSLDPDDAVSLETENGRQILYVHVADPAASITINSPSEKEARDCGATLYIPEGSFRMLAEEALPIFALGLTELSPALTFKMTLNNYGEIEQTDIFPSTVKVSRLTYEEADKLILTAEGIEAEKLNALYSLAERNIKRRSMAGAINIVLPEIHIGLDQEIVTIKPLAQYHSADLVQECMLLAGEGAGIWAMQHNVSIPYIEQETGEIPDDIPSGIAGSYQLRRCMRPRILSVKPGRHCGLGLDTYTQVTSPLRRYTDLLAHIQIRAFLRGEKTLSADEVMARMSAGEAAITAVTQAERASRNHWLMVYLSGKKDSVWDAIALEKKGNRWITIIPALALETQVPWVPLGSRRSAIAPNDPLRLILKSANIPKGEAVFIAEE